MGSGALGIHEIFEHEFFYGVDFENLNDYEPSFKPNLNDINALDIKSIGDFPNNKEVDKLELTDEDQNIYKNCNYVDKIAYESEVVEFLMYEDIMVCHNVYIYLYYYYHYSFVTTKQYMFNSLLIIHCSIYLYIFNYI